MNKKYFRPFLLISLAVMICAALLGEGILLPAQIANAADTIVNFPDPGLEAAVRAALYRSADTDPIYAGELSSLTELNAGSRNIVDLTGLQYCGNLQLLFLWDNQIVDITRLQNLTNLQYLTLNNNQITNIGPLEGLTNLIHLEVISNHITDISALHNLTNLQILLAEHNHINSISGLRYLANLARLELDWNQISDINVLQYLSGLHVLTLSNNQITDISALQNLPNLELLSLYNNRINDISSLALNSQLAGGDSIDLRFNFLDISSGSPDMAAINTLTGRGATVGYGPQNTLVLSQVWRLDSATDASSNRIMENSGTQTDGVLVENDDVVLWLSDQQATDDVAFNAGTWTVYLNTTDWTGDYSVQIGESEGASSFLPFDLPVTGLANGLPITLYEYIPAKTLTKDHYLALHITNSGTGSIITNGSSYLGAPTSTPSYPVPEMSAGILAGLGLTGLVAYVLVKRRKATAGIKA
jgi:hypothetical protein